MGLDWKDRKAQWERFNEWESRQLQNLPSDFVAALAWMSEAWELARRSDPEWGSLRVAEEHWRHLARVRAALAHLRPRA